MLIWQRAFDKISHGHLLDNARRFPREGDDRRVAEGRDFEAGKGFAPTGEGTPQGGIITPPTQ